MKYIEYGTNKQKVSTLMLGLMRIADMEVDAVEELIDIALDQGINALDLADIYGGGKCEEKVGEILKKRPELRKELWIQTKAGIRQEDVTYFDFSKYYIIESVNKSLKRLNTDYLDSFLLHRPDVLCDLDEIAEAFQQLHDEGKVINFGVSNMNPMQIQMIQRKVSFPIVCDQLQLSVMHTPIIDAGFQVNMHWDGAFDKSGNVLEYCRTHGIVIQSWSSLQYGYFEGTFIDNEKFPEVNEVLGRIADNYQVSKSAVALAWILRIPAKMQVVIGTTSIDHLFEAVNATEITLTKKEWYEIYQAAGNKLP